MQTGVYSNGNWFCHKCIALPALTSRLSPRRVSAAALDHSAPTEPHKTLMAGSFPNLGWNAIGMEELRNLPAFGALPSVWDVSLVNPTSYRYVRQDTDLWDALHQGIVTGGRLNNVLGFYEPLAGKMLGVPRSRISHQPLLSMQHQEEEPTAPKWQSGRRQALFSRVSGKIGGKDAVEGWHGTQISCGCIWRCWAGNADLRQPRPINKWLPEGGDNVILEVVELKNTCPFQEAGTVIRTRKGQLRRQYRIGDPGPRDRVPTYWVPQLQLEMLTSGAQYAMLVSRSATQGIRLFRMERDETFLRLMLQHISLLYTQHVIPRRAPPADLHWQSPAYQQLLHLTLRISADTPELAYMPDPAASPTCDRRPFL
ncbi:hypothetical protein WJX84_002718 [Apatococcus fuscideae]|uniref:YqaJ viral recombinase domain-containing protein n=1 Tax=Apatococcus fuscideae TaxID=2026836 RepID=A0AAW1SMR5_9CHLO